VEKGWIHDAISTAAYDYQKKIESGEMPIIGVNCFNIENEVLPIELFRVPETKDIQEEKLQRIRKERNSAKVQKALDRLAQGCENGHNLMELVVEGAKSHITEGEVSGILKKVYGVWNPPLF
jgi:methylmalonyl-CoA mutase N-terminal domain/subunit